MMIAPIFAEMQLQNTDYQNAMTIQAQMQADNQKSEMDRWKIAQDTQTKIFEIQQEVAQFKAQTQDKAFKKWDDFVKE